MDVNGAIDAFKSVATSHPYLALAVLLFIIGSLVGKKAGLIFYFLGAIALFQEFSLLSTFIEFLKSLPDKISALTGVFGGV